MKLRQSNPFTLIELLIVIGIIGILATVVIPSVGDALNDAKRTAAQVACKTFEEDMVKFDAANGGMIKSYAISIKDETNSDTVQQNLYLLLSGQKDFVSGALATSTNKTTSESSTHTVTDGTNYFQPKISAAGLTFDDTTGNLKTAPTGTDTGFAANKFNNPYMYCYRTGTNGGTITVRHPEGAYIELQGLKRGDSKIRVVCWDDTLPGRLITKDGVYQLYEADGTTLVPEDAEISGPYKIKLQ